MNQERFLAACRSVMQQRTAARQNGTAQRKPPSFARWNEVPSDTITTPPQEEGGDPASIECSKVLIGTLGEKTLHAVLKHYLEPDISKHEIKIGPYYADICDGDGIIEIQTKQFDKLRGKLEAFLPRYPVTVVYPVAFQKRLIWIDENTGETTPPRRSPKRGNACAIFPELYKIKSFLTNGNLQIRILLVDIDEYRRLNGWSKDRKKGSWCSDRIPVGVQDDVLLSCPDDYGQLIPNGLPPQFSTKDLSKEAKISRSAAQTALNVLYSLGAVRRIGKQGNAFLYEQCDHTIADQDENGDC